LVSGDNISGDDCRETDVNRAVINMSSPLNIVNIPDNFGIFWGWFLRRLWPGAAMKIFSTSPYFSSVVFALKSSHGGKDLWGKRRSNILAICKIAPIGPVRYTGR
jgi:hypothetical protein